MLSKLFPDNSLDEPTEIETESIVIRGKTLIYGNVLYQISNISSAGIVDFSKVKKVPRQYWFWSAVSIAMLLANDTGVRFAGIALGCLMSFLFYWHFQTRLMEKYGLTIYTNAGDKKIFISRDKELLLKILFVLHNVMNGQDKEGVVFNLENSTFNEFSIDKNIGSPVLAGKISGNANINTTFAEEVIL